MSLGEPNVKRALDWILQRLADDPHAKRGGLVEEAAREFDLSPLDEDFLLRHLSEGAQAQASKPAQP